MKDFIYVSRIATALTVVCCSLPAAAGTVRLSTNNGNFIAGDSANFVDDEQRMSTVGGGGGNSDLSLDPFTPCMPHSIEGSYSTIGGGACHSIYGETPHYATIGGGAFNVVGSFGGTVAGGYRNIVGSFDPEVQDGFAAIGGGSFNTASGQGATVAGGSDNAAAGVYSTVAGGLGNSALGEFSFAAGRGASIRPEGTGVFFWSDSTATETSFDIGAANTFNARATGGVRFWASHDPALGVRLAPGATSWTVASDRDLKTGFENVDGREVLEKVAAMPIKRWYYKADGARTPHMGPVAQDFYAAFALGGDDKGIQTIDADGVALAAIQGLHAVVKSMEAQMAARDAEILDLRSRLEALAVGIDRPVARAIDH